MSGAQMLPSNRDLATLLILGAAVTGVLASSAGRKAARTLFAVLWGKLLATLLIYVGYIVGIVLVADLLGLWRRAMLGETLAWLLLSGLVMFGRFTAVGKDRWFFRNSLRALIEVGALVALLASVVTFNLFMEIALAVVATVVLVLKAVADMDDKLRPLRPLTAWMLALIGASVGLATIWNLASNWDALDKGAIVFSLAMAFWLPIATLPMVTAIGTFAEYETAFMRLEFMAGTTNKWLARGALISGLLVRPHLIAGFTHPWRWELRQATSWSRAREVVGRYRSAHTRSLKALLNREARSLRRIASTRRRMGRDPRQANLSDSTALLLRASVRPAGWEYILFGQVLSHLLSHVQSWETLRERSPNAMSGSVPSRSAARKVLARYPRRASEAMEGFDALFDMDRQEKAFGAPGEAGNAVRIVNLATEVIRLYTELRDLGQSLRDIQMEDDLLAAREALYAMTDEPASQIADFVTDVYRRTERLPALLSTGQPVELIMTLTLTVSDETVEAVQEALSAL